MHLGPAQGLVEAVCSDQLGWQRVRVRRAQRPDRGPIGRQAGSACGPGAPAGRAVARATADARAACRAGRLRAWLDALLWECGPGAPDVLRAKGVLALAGRPERHVLQAARGPGGSGA